MPKFLLLASLCCQLLAAELPLGPEAASPAKVGDRPAADSPVLVRTPDGKTVDVQEWVTENPTILIFYRGGWCPYCNTHMGELAAIEDELVELGYTLLAVSPERTETLESFQKENEIPDSIVLLSDRDGEAARALGVAYQMLPENQQRYIEYGLDLASIDGDESRRWLPVPSAFVFDAAGTITFAFSNADYTVRIDPADLINAAKRSLAP